MLGIQLNPKVHITHVLLSPTLCSEVMVTESLSILLAGEQWVGRWVGLEEGQERAWISVTVSGAVDDAHVTGRLQGWDVR